jgi:hypothetical protein
MAKKAATNPAPEASEKVSEEVVISTVPETFETLETEVTASTLIDQPAVSGGESASSFSDLSETASDPTLKDKASEAGATDAPSSPAESAIAEPVIIQGGGGSFDSAFAEPKPGPTMVERIELLEARLAALEAK